ncbi:MAG TPA: isoprenylcysteine carboxylmethyltransferase family protein [Thermodesulfobacteriota bacterium]|nr:isoprenylcysteine carboxylmethyltransferase family protein [Thermodesulfobacteriota bacterium]
MYLDLIVQIAAMVLWLAAEAYLILRDRAHGKGKREIDRRTRNFNTIATVVTLVLAPIANWAPVLRFDVPGATVVFWLGIVVMLLGLFLRHWSIIVLGRYFRTTIELEKGQKVIQKGPYKYVRHPSYAGIVVFFVGYGLLSKNWLSLLAAACLPTVSLVYRIRIEEVALAEGLGAEYAAYQRKTKKLIPGIW